MRMPTEKENQLYAAEFNRLQNLIDGSNNQALGYLQLFGAALTVGDEKGAEDARFKYHTACDVMFDAMLEQKKLTTDMVNRMHGITK